ncbi:MULTISPECIES: hypothetical protein [unclassified Mesorhizobium]|uniref:hypothetical protein n=1 Tax=unclassified Mesorhizobium TaxID=325217 RepID=UPI001091A10B|nr:MULTISPECIES: hypothetical protein [unclassified Mesorhizobium]TGQ37853.1 hypothetical protein EN857_14290 [Mesorhizobium sp. M4B.F.Ca.ET.214.01.1.1]TGQ59620.1 hypothetical protein EN854_17020 [Mesorhizobium sp. M4B.F.Ca.ET.211.01.1.1]TGU34686.1 hypothetical protein EN793_17015 [Mesorhizobium sp. M4B.F.Ca.ET.150.01.1.1]
MDSLTRAAASLGDSPAQNFLRMFFPMSAPCIRAAGLLLFVFALEFYIIPSLLGGPNTIVPLMLMNATLNWPPAATVATVLLAIRLVLYGISSYFMGIEPLLGSQRGAGQSAGTTVRYSTSVQLVDLATVLVRAVGGSVRFLAGILYWWCVSGPDTLALPIKMWSGIREEITPTITAVSSLLIASQSVSMSS